VVDDVPYAIEDNKIYVRDEAETNLAVRDEIVQLVRRKAAVQAPVHCPKLRRSSLRLPAAKLRLHRMAKSRRHRLAWENRRDRRAWRHPVSHHARSAKRQRGSERHAQIGPQPVALCISQHESRPVEVDKVAWRGDLGMLDQLQTRRQNRYDLVQRLPEGRLRVYYGVTDDGIHGEWRKIVDWRVRRRCRAGIRTLCRNPQSDDSRGDSHSE